MTSEFDADTAISRVAAGAYRAEVSSRWNVADKPNGGYLLALALRAATAELPLPHPFTATAHYLRAPVPGPALLDVEVVRAGRTHATAEVRLLQEDTEVLRALTTFGDLGTLSGPTHVAAGPPDFPPVEECLTGRAAAMPDGTPVAIAERFDMAVHPDTLGWPRGQPTGSAQVGAWVRLVDGRDPDPLMLAMVVDALPPPVFDIGAAGWVPTIELTTHIRALPAPGWLRVWVTTRFLQGGYLEEDAEVWDSEGILVAQSRQLARLTGWTQQQH
ncbi:MAG: thioesterase family protein [Nitriliruptorales bacterium]|nr:thioesterase family protein [Nitriliruptorales bacterium]